MNILLITGPYPPEIRAISFMMKELAEELVSRGHDVAVAALWPKCSLSADAQKAKFNVFADENGVKVIRIKAPSPHKGNFLLRGLGQLIMPYLFLKKINKFVSQKIEAVIVYSPPLPLALVGMEIKRKYGARFLLNIQDIFPQNAVDLGIMKNRALISFFERMENRVYKEADKISSHTKNSRKFLMEKKGISEGKIAVIHNWVDESGFKPIRNFGEFRRRYGLEGKFVFLFAGMMGPAQNLGFIIETARRVGDIQDICFLFVGDGSEKKKLQNMANGYGLKNVQFQPFVSREEYAVLVREADAGMACLSAKNKTPVIPGKILGFMAAAIPVGAFLNKESDGHELIKEARCGYSALSDDLDAAERLIRRIFNERDRIDEYGQNGYNYAVANFNKKGCIDRIERLIR